MFRASCRCRVRQRCGMRTELIQRFNDLQPQRAALARRLRYVDDPQAEVDLAMWTKLVESPHRSDCDLYWAVMNLLRSTRRRKCRDLRRLRSLIDDPIQVLESNIEDQVLDRVEAAEAMATLPATLSRRIAQRAGYITGRQRLTAAERSKLSRWRQQHRRVAQ